MQRRLIDHFCILNSKMKRILGACSIFVFLIFLNISTLGWFTGITSQTDNSEHRALANFPSIDVSKPLDFPRDFEKYINDNFGFRSLFINLYTSVKVNLFRSPPFITEILGKNNWIFFNPVNRDDFKGWYKQVEFSREELESMKIKLQAEKNWLSSKNIPYLVVIVPDKEDVYPEYYPYAEMIGDIKLNQFLEYMKKNSDVNVLYLKQALLDAKNEYNYPLYYLYDTHWNNLGSFIGYQQIMKTLKEYNPSVQILQKDDFEIIAEPNPPTSVLDLIRGSVFWTDQPEIRMHFKIKEDSVSKIKKLTNIQVYGDSFTHAKKWPDAEMEGLVKYLMLGFTKFTNFYDAPAYALEYSEIERDKPEIVIREVIQRNLSVLNAITCNDIIRCN